MLTWNPDVIVTVDRDFAQSVKVDPTWASVAAVKQGQVYLAPRLPFGWVDFPPSVNRLIGLWWLARIFYPTRIPESIRFLTYEFYSKFYHVTPTDDQIAHILAG